MIKLAEKHCKQMMELIYKKKMAYFEKGGDEDWKQILVNETGRDFNASQKSNIRFSCFRPGATLRIPRRCPRRSTTRNR